MKFDLYFLKNALKNWLPWCCSADKILHWLPLSSSNGLLFILSFRSPHLNVFSKEARYKTEGISGARPLFSWARVHLSRRGDLPLQGRGGLGGGTSQTPLLWAAGSQSGKEPLYICHNVNGMAALG